MMRNRLKLLIVSGARPNFMKIAPLIRALSTQSKVQIKKKLTWKIVHTGQHYDDRMSRIFFEDLELPKSLILILA